MADDIGTLLRDAAADPKHTPDFDGLATRGRRQHVAARAGTALAVALVLAVGSIVLWPGLWPAGMPIIGERPSVPTGVETVELPDGWQRVEIGRAVFGVPGDWEVMHTDDSPGAACTLFFSTPPRAVIGPIPPNVRCPAPNTNNSGPGLHASAITADARNRRPDTTENLLVNGWPATRRTETRSVQTDGQLIEATFDVYLVEGLDLYLKIRTDTSPQLARQILATVSLEDTTSPPGASDAPSPTGSLSFPRPVADDPDAFVRAGAAGRMVDCDGPIHLGGWAVDFGGSAVGATDPHAALETFLDDGLFGLPGDGYQLVATEPGRALFTYEVGRSRKVAVIVADGTVVKEQVSAPDGWAAEVFATCDPAEYDPSADDTLGRTVWTDRDGNRVPTATITSFPGPSHCDWETVTFLHLNDAQYLRDPEHRLTEAMVQPYDVDVELPAEATDTGYRRGPDELWLSADGTIAYLVTDNRVEAWPSTRYPVGCA